MPRMAPKADSVRDLVRAKLEEKRISMADASRRLGKNRAYIQQFLERNTPVRLPEDVREELASMLGLVPETLRGGAIAPVALAGSFRRQAPAGPPDRQESAVVPIMGTVEGGDDGSFPWNGEVVDYLPRPAALAGAVGAYALYVSGTSMSPRYEPGEPIFVHPGRPVAAGSYVVLQIRPRSEGEAPLGYIKRFVKKTPTKIIVEQFNPPKQREFRIEDVIRMHRIVGSGEL